LGLETRVGFAGLSYVLQDRTGDHEGGVLPSGAPVTRTSLLSTQVPAASVPCLEQPEVSPQLSKYLGYPLEPQCCELREVISFLYKFASP
jgi:hypothetical protein